MKLFDDLVKLVQIFFQKPAHPLLSHPCYSSCRERRIQWSQMSIISRSKGTGGFTHLTSDTMYNGGTSISAVQQHNMGSIIRRTFVTAVIKILLIER